SKLDKIDFPILTNTKNYKNNNNNTIFITGSTGYLGRYILTELLNLGFKCMCLVRGNNSYKRLKKILKSQLLWNNTFKNKIVIINGDLSVEKFGLNDHEYIQLQKNINYIINCAQESSWILE